VAGTLLVAGAGCIELAARVLQRSEDVVEHETIYQSFFVQGRGELRRELARVLRSGQTRPPVKGQQKPAGVLPDMMTISERQPKSPTEQSPVTGRATSFAARTTVPRSARSSSARPAT